MKNFAKAIAGLSLFGIFAACSSPDDDAAPEDFDNAVAEENLARAPADEAISESKADDESCAEELQANEEQLQMSLDATQNIMPLGKKCWATCTVVAIAPNTFCPATMGGYGFTTFLGGCKKACDRARADAASKLPSGCVINNCSYNGC